MMYFPSQSGKWIQRSRQTLLYPSGIMKSLSWDLGTLGPWELSSGHVVKELSMAPQRAANHTLLVQCPAIFFYTKQCNPRQQVNRQLCVKFHADTWHDLLAVISLQKKQNLFCILGPTWAPSQARPLCIASAFPSRWRPTFPACH